MQYRLLGASGLKVPVISLGSGTFGGGNEFFRAWGATDVEEAKRLIDVALEAGANLFDSADVYSDGLAETILGKAIAGRRDQVLISSKASFRTGPGPNHIGSSRHHLIAACEASLRRLGTDHIDLWQMHGFDAATPLDETLRALDDLITAGKVRYIGCSNFSGWHLMKALSVSEGHGWSRYIAHQAYYSLLAREYELELMPLALDQKVGALVWSPLSGGRLSGKLGRNKTAPAGSRVATQGGVSQDYPEQQFYQITDALEQIAAGIGRSVSQVALNWVIQRPSVASVIIGARNEEQLRQNLAAAEFTLTAEQVALLDQVSERPMPYPYWHQRYVFGERIAMPVTYS
ncbi:MAG: aldo/keto reductase [Pseudomonadota bacterium]